jgi:hypothetical protein
MSRIQYEIGARRGTEEAVEAFIRNLRDTYDDYYAGRYSEPDFRSVQRVTWDEPAEFYAQLRLWLVRWSRLHPNVEIFATSSGKNGSDSIEYVSFRGGEFYVGQKIAGHARFEEVVSTCECVTRPGYYEKYPTETPFVDCPIRLNPPTAWAVENIMYAMERLPVRRTR